MSNVKIVTDSTADIPLDLAEDLDITVIPLNVIFSEGDTYDDGVTLRSDQFYEKVSETGIIPKTSQPTPHRFEEVYRSLLEEDTTILSIHLSSKLSGTYQTATIAKQNVDENRIHVIDTKKASYSIGLIVVELARMVKANKGLTECLDRLDYLLTDTSVYFMVDTLDYLKKNGRIGGASALLGTVLKIKPILSLTDDGEVYTYEKVRGQKKATARIIDVLKEQYGKEPIHVGISHAQNESLANEMIRRVKEDFDVSSEVITSIGAVIGAHVGPGAISISMTKAR